MEVLTAKQQVAALIVEANDYKGENVYQDVFYQSELVDVDATADSDTGVVVLVCGEKLVWDDQSKTWI